MSKPVRSIDQSNWREILLRYISEYGAIIEARIERPTPTIHESLERKRIQIFRIIGALEFTGAPIIPADSICHNPPRYIPNGPSQESKERTIRKQLSHSN